jgi:hypothetical protein
MSSSTHSPVGAPESRRVALIVATAPVSGTARFTM